MPSTMTALSVALALFVVGLGLISAGSSGDTDALWVVGLALLAGAGLIGPAMRFAGDQEDDA